MNSLPQAKSAVLTRNLSGGFHGLMNPFSLDPPRSLHPLSGRHLHSAQIRRARFIITALFLSFVLALAAPAGDGAAQADTRGSSGSGGTRGAGGSSRAGGSSGAGASETTWVSPVPAMEIVEAFDPPDKPWLKGHRGIDVLAVDGEPLRAPTAGSIRFRGSVAGTPTVSIETDTGHVVSFQPASTEMKKGDEFAAGEEIGVVAEGSHCEKSCLHIGVWTAASNKDYIDPAQFFGHEQSILLPLKRKPAEEPAGGSDSTTSGAGAWGGHSNGRIPASAMCPLTTSPGHMLRCDAQKAFDRLSHAFEARFKVPISVTDSYRDYATQVILKKRKGRMAATPGTSNHGWALAVDLGGGINSFGSAQHQWMRANAPKFGWIHPGWARQTGSLPEPWHWEFRK